VRLEHLGVFLRSFTWGSARQLDQVAGQALTRAWAAGAGPGPWPVIIDLDATHCGTNGLHKRGASKIGRDGMGGYHPLPALWPQGPSHAADRAARTAHPGQPARLVFCDWDYHAFVTDRDGPTLELEADHRRHAEVET
jgi:hypothetical protein